MYTRQVPYIYIYIHASANGHQRGNAKLHANELPKVLTVVDQVTSAKNPLVDIPNNCTPTINTDYTTQCI